MGDLNLDGISRIKVDGSDPKITNQDARIVYVTKEDSDYKRTSDFMLGNDDKGLKDGEYVNAEEYIKAAEGLFAREEVKQIQMVKTGKKIKPQHLKEEVERTKKAAVITLNNNSKVKNQDARLVSVKTKKMDSMKSVAGMFLGKNGTKMGNGDYVLSEDVEFVITKKKKPKEPIDSKEKNIMMLKGLGTLATVVGLGALVPFIMHADSVMWHHSTPEIQTILHGINLALGKLVNFSYEGGTGLWTMPSGAFMNADAETSSILVAIGTYGLTALGITKLTNDIKNGVVKVTEKMQEKIEDQNDIGGVKAI